MDTQPEIDERRSSRSVGESAQAMGLVKKEHPKGDGADRRPRECDTSSLVVALHHQDPEVRRSATLDLRGNPDAIGPLLQAYLLETDPPTREAMLNVLADHDDPAVARAFVDDLADDDVMVRNAAATALEAMPCGVGLLIADLLGDTRVRVRIMAMTVLAGVEHPDVPVWLANVVRVDDDENVVAAAVDAALAAGDETAGLLAVAVRRFPGNPYLAFLADVSAVTP